MSRARAATDTARALYRTWGAAGLRRRATYEMQRRTGAIPKAEERWLASLRGRDVRLSPVRPAVLPEVTSAPPDTGIIALYGALELTPEWPASWHRHPLTGHTFDLAHWSVLREGDPATGDIKDLWELGRLTWLGPFLQRAAAGDDDAAEACWRHVESFASHNPPYSGPQWMCGQESALRGIMVSLVASTLRQHAVTTTNRLDLVADLVAATVGRVRPTIGYALSQRNNHAISEAAFLWTVPHLLDGLPHADRVGDEGARALSEAVADQFYEDGAYAQHSPTYERLAMHGLLWVLAVARAADASVPTGVLDAVRRSHSFLVSLADHSTGALPNLGGNDGALLFALTNRSIGDFRPALAHAAAAARIPTPIGDGGEEASWFRLEPTTAGAVSEVGLGIGHHVLRGRSSHAVLRAGAMRHRPAHADQLHVDVWIGGVNAAGDAGSFRYTAPSPWQNALADEEVHNVIRLPGEPQALRRGRFLWVRWCEARIVSRAHCGDVEGMLCELALLSGTTMRRFLGRTGDTYNVLDWSSDCGGLVRWNLPAGTTIDTSSGATTAYAHGWEASFTHGGMAQVLTPSDDNPRSGWVAPTYSKRQPVLAVLLRLDEAGFATSSFRPEGQRLPPAPVEALQAQNDSHLREVLHEWARRLVESGDRVIRRVTPDAGPS